MCESCGTHLRLLYLQSELERGDVPMKTWLKPEITESEAGMEVTSYLPAELDRA
ncbi:pyrroloquinoline quinone precursor peptide PqqA [Methyloligella solikamskensis]